MSPTGPSAVVSTARDGPARRERTSGLRCMLVRSVIRGAALRISPIRRVYEAMQLAAAEASTANAKIAELSARISEADAAVAAANAAHAEEIEVLGVLLEAAERERDTLTARLKEVRGRAASAVTANSQAISPVLTEIKLLGARLSNLTSALTIPAAAHGDKAEAVAFISTCSRWH